jgi:hypothetical protein
MHSLPALPGLWCVCCSMLPVCGPFCVLGPWHVRQSALPGSRTIPGIVRAMRVVATETGNTAGVHEARDEIIALHPVLMCGPVREMSERTFPELVFL